MKGTRICNLDDRSKSENVKRSIVLVIRELTISRVLVSTLGKFKKINQLGSLLLV